jgi:hypothetical protein
MASWENQFLQNILCETTHAIAVNNTNNRYGQRRCLEARHINMNQRWRNLFGAKIYPPCCKMTSSLAQLVNDVIPSQSTENIEVR